MLFKIPAFIYWNIDVQDSIEDRSTAVELHIYWSLARIWESTWRLTSSIQRFSTAQQDAVINIGLPSCVDSYYFPYSQSLRFWIAHLKSPNPDFLKTKLWAVGKQIKIKILYYVLEFNFRMNVTQGFLVLAVSCTVLEWCSRDCRIPCSWLWSKQILGKISQLTRCNTKCAEHYVSFPSCSCGNIEYIKFQSRSAIHSLSECMEALVPQEYWKLKSRYHIALTWRIITLAEKAFRQ